MSATRKIYFHEDDYCRQELLPRDAAAHVQAEIEKIGKFADAHVAPDGPGWTDIYVRTEAPVRLGALRITKEEFAATVDRFLPPFDKVLTGYGSYVEECKRAGAWGTSMVCALFADWNEDGIIRHAWAALSSLEEESLLAASKAVVALGKMRPLIYVDWAWSYTCELNDEEVFASLLRKKLNTIVSKHKSQGS